MTQVREVITLRTNAQVIRLFLEVAQWQLESWTARDVVVPCNGQVVHQLNQVTNHV